jgi:glycosyltransferase involved in cell wall biosynthesis
VTRVGWVIDSRTYGGAERCVVQLVRGLPELARVVVCTAPAPDRLVLALARAGAEVRTVPPAGVAAALAGADIAHVNMTDPATCGAVLATTLGTGLPTVVDVHMTGTVDPALAGPYRACAAVLTRSAQVAGQLRTAYGIEPTVVRNGVPIVPAPRPADRPAGSPGPGGQTPAVGTRVGEPAVGEPAAGGPAAGGPVRIRGVGRLTAQKGFDLLIAATRRLLGAGVPVEVAIAGEGRNRAALAGAAAGLPVRLAGHVEDVPAFLAGADVFCLPSRAEALPLALLEAAVAGLPCVATDVGDIAAELGDLVMLVRPGDLDGLTAALTRLATEPDTRRRLGARAQSAAVTRFDERAAVAAVRAVYSKLTWRSTAAAGS